MMSYDKLEILPVSDKEYPSHYTCYPDLLTRARVVHASLIHIQQYGSGIYASGDDEDFWIPYRTVINLHSFSAEEVKYVGDQLWVERVKRMDYVREDTEEVFE